jgi:hypothetical protein
MSGETTLPGYTEETPIRGPATRSDTGDIAGALEEGFIGARSVDQLLTQGLLIPNLSGSGWTANL